MLRKVTRSFIVPQKITSAIITDDRTKSDKIGHFLFGRRKSAMTTESSRAQELPPPVRESDSFSLNNVHPEQLDIASRFLRHVILRPCANRPKSGVVIPATISRLKEGPRLSSSTTVLGPGANGGARRTELLGLLHQKSRHISDSDSDFDTK
jgi:hypothetical protein